MQGVQMRFGEYLQQNGICKPEDVKQALAVQAFRPEKLGRILVELGFLDATRLNGALVGYLCSSKPPSYKELAELRAHVAIESREQLEAELPDFLLVSQNEQLITVVTTAFCDDMVHKLEERVQREVQIIVVGRSVFRLLRGGEDKAQKTEAGIIVAGELSCDQKIREDDAHTRMVRECLETACREKASDVHFEPFSDQYLIRLRIHGVLQDWKSVSSDHIEPLTNKLKWILNLDLAVAARPQDSRASFDSWAVDMRVNSMPTACGSEKIVIRIQYQEEKLSLHDIGLDARKIEVLRRNINKREGLIVISGPTGSGKTTTLYALLEEMDRLGKNISTLENPVEKSLERINQSNVATAEDFYEFQRALMRQDPDVILLGEIRDPETADLSMKLASTGHLVLSTVHANGAREVIDRLLNLGIDDFTVKNNLRLSVAQRLVRKICLHCRKSVSGGGYRTNSSGCEHCKSGVSGRMAIIEYLERQDLDSQNPPTTLGKECHLLAEQGIIDISELNSM